MPKLCVPASSLSACPRWTKRDGSVVLYCEDVLKMLSGPLRERRFACAFLDPPDAIGLKSEGYLEWEREGYISQLSRVLCPTIARCGIVWLSYNSIWDLAVKHWAFIYGSSCPNLEIKPFTWSYTFGQNRTTDCGPGFRPLLRFRQKVAPLYPEQILIPSWRMLNGDKRAAEGGRVPLDHWGDFPRIVGNAKERRPFIPTQHPEGLLERAIKLSTKTGDTVLDLFSGSGTAIRVCSRIGRRVVSVEKSRMYCEQIAREHGLVYHA